MDTLPEGYKLVICTKGYRVEAPSGVVMPKVCRTKASAIRFANKAARFFKTGK